MNRKETTMGRSRKKVAKDMILDVLNKCSFVDVRTVDDDGSTMYYSRDVCNALGILDASHAVARHCGRRGDRMFPVDTGRGVRLGRYLAADEVLKLARSCKAVDQSITESLESVIDVQDNEAEDECRCGRRGCKGHSKDNDCYNFGMRLEFKSLEQFSVFDAALHYMLHSVLEDCRSSIDCHSSKGRCTMKLLLDVDPQQEHLLERLYNVMDGMGVVHEELFMPF